MGGAQDGGVQNGRVSLGSAENEDLGKLKVESDLGEVTERSSRSRGYWLIMGRCRRVIIDWKFGKYKVERKREKTSTDDQSSGSEFYLWDGVSVLSERTRRKKQEKHVAWKRRAVVRSLRKYENNWVEKWNGKKTKIEGGFGEL